MQLIFESTKRSDTSCQKILSALILRLENSTFTIDPSMLLTAKTGLVTRKRE